MDAHTVRSPDTITQGQALRLSKLMSTAHDHKNLVMLTFQDVAHHGLGSCPGLMCEILHCVQYDKQVLLFIV